MSFKVFDASSSLIWIQCSPAFINFFSIVFNFWYIYFDNLVINWMLSIAKKFFFFQEGHRITIFPKLFLIVKGCFLDESVIICCSVAQPCMPCFPVLHHLLEFAQTHVHWVGDAIQPSHPPSIFHSIKVWLCIFCVFNKFEILVQCSVQLSSVTQSYLTLCDPKNCSTLRFPVRHQLPEIAQTHVHRVGDAVQPSHPLLSPSPPTFNHSQHQGLFK